MVTLAAMGSGDGGGEASLLRNLRTRISEAGSAGTYLPGTLTAFVVVLGALADQGMG